MVTIRNSLDGKKHAKMVGIGRVAANLFNKKGYLKTSIDNIAYATRVSKGGIFYYFPTKHDILYFILNNYIDLILVNLDEDLKDIEPAFSKIQFIISRHINIYNQNIAEGKILLREAHNLPSKYFKTISEKQKRYFKIMAKLISDLLNGSISKAEVTAITFSLFGMINWIYTWYDPRGSLSAEELSKIIYSIFARGATSASRNGGNTPEVTCSIK